ncbi:hypothetical protein [Kerstersia gyiorum]|uniref:hypothetical protein n=1 Tax=Kerstersia gyiorum TaxID=206506 RepID=UPI00209FA521|nr:hypothetical protein [Kerstersia gyiorum]MCP1633215.1 hypothetical protein [Kerstersia gyiorum]MCP1636085.1 hypothetical protein [Kerstersia gyiorum]MCP1672223.1 hypothetical protein [Kerstersia gyiorum]MCP1681798.1 hypothetical protein [Kerstersia gyiorum]MCP1710221.1 hypothetical protein [Kerstersia gyiorum]
MIEIAFNLLAVLISVYWVGEKTRKNPRIDAFLSAIEGNYSRLNSRLEDATIVSGLRFLRQFYGWASIFLFACLFVFQRFSQPSPKNFLSLFWVCGFAFIGWFSIKWVTEHKNTINEFSKNNALIIFGPLLMSIFDLIFHTSFTEILLISFQQAAAVLHFNIPDTSNPLAIGGAVSLVLFGFFLLLLFACLGCSSSSVYVLCICSGAPHQVRTRSSTNRSQQHFFLVYRVCDECNFVIANTAIVG